VFLPRVKSPVVSLRAVSAQPFLTWSCAALLIQGGPIMPITNSELRQCVQRWLTSGALFAAPQTFRAGHGSGTLCRVCGSPIRELEIEYEIADEANGKVVVHRQCYLIWREESEAAGGRRWTLMGSLATVSLAGSVNTEEIVLKIEESSEVETSVLDTGSSPANAASVLKYPPDGPAVPDSCAESERVFTRLARYARGGAVGAALARVLSAVLRAGGLD
jgi:hypothetical protein